MGIAIGTVVLLMVWLVFVFSARNPDRWLRNSRDEGTRELLDELEDSFPPVSLRSAPTPGRKKSGSCFSLSDR